MPIPNIDPGSPIAAAWLNLLVAEANRHGARAGINAGDGAVGTSWARAAVERPVRMCAVVARNVPDEGPWHLHQIEYDLNIPGLGVAKATFDKRIVDVPPQYIGETADPAAVFHPAAVVGSAEFNAAPWRGYGVVYILGVGDNDGAPRWFCRLFGEILAVGCEV